MIKYNQAMHYLRQNGFQVGEDAEEGIPGAQEVMDAYSFHYSSPGDPGGQMLLCVKLEEYLKTKEAIA